MLILVMAWVLYGLGMSASSLVSDDEGMNLYPAWRVSLGERLYADVAFDHTPVAVYLGALLFDAAGPSHLAAKRLTVVFSLLAALFAYLVAEVGYGRETALLALALLVSNAYWHHFAGYFTSDAFFLCFYLASLYYFFAGWRAGAGWKPFFTAGFAGGVAVFCKLFGLFAFGGTFLFLAVRFLEGDPVQPVRRRAVLAVVMMTLGGAVSAALLLLPLLPDLPRFLELTVTHHRKALQDLHPLWVFYAFFAVLFGPSPTAHRLLLLLGLIGLTATRRQPSEPRLLLVCHAAQALAFLFTGHEFYARHLLFLLPLLSIATADELRYLTGESGEARRIGRLAGAFILVTALAEFSSERPPRKDVELVDHITATTSPGDTIFTEYGEVAFLARRRNVPLPDVPASGNDPAAGVFRLTGGQIVRALEHERPALVLLKKKGEAPTSDNHILGQISDEALLTEYLASRWRLEESTAPALREWLFYRPHE